MGRRWAGAKTAGSTMKVVPTETATAPNTVEKLLLAAPRGYCAGVDRAVQTVERALDLHGPPVYVRKQIVHNKHVVELLAARGAVVRRGRRTKSPRVRSPSSPLTGSRRRCASDAQARKLDTIDATCPLVTKVHREALHFAEDGYTIVLVGHAGHEEVQGTMGEAPEQHRAGRERAGRRRAGGRGSRARRLRHPDDALGR